MFAKAKAAAAAAAEAASRNAKAAADKAKSMRSSGGAGATPAKGENKFLSPVNKKASQPQQQQQPRPPEDGSEAPPPDGPPPAYSDAVPGVIDIGDLLSGGEPTSAPLSPFDESRLARARPPSPSRDDESN